MQKRAMLPAIALTVVCLLNACVQLQAQDAIKSSLTIEQAKEKLEELSIALRGIDEAVNDELKQEVRKQVSTAPKDEFETTQEYNSRCLRAQNIWEQLKDKYDREKEKRRVELKRQIDEILDLEFMQPEDFELGLYNADSQKFHLNILRLNYQGEIFIPRGEAKELKENFANAEKTAVYGLFLESGWAKPYLITARIKFRDKQYQIESERPNPARALFLLYGNYDVSENRARLNSSEIDSQFSRLSDDTHFARIFFSTNYQEEGKDKVLFLTSIAPKEYDCRVCIPIIGGITFSRKGNIWKVDVARKYILQSGSFGEPSESKLIKIGVDKHGILFNKEDSHMGVNWRGVEILTDVDKSFKLILSVDTFYDTFQESKNSKQYESYNSKLDFLPNNDSPYFDIRVTTSGVRAKVLNRRVVLRPFTEVKVYALSDGEYREKSKPKVANQITSLCEALSNGSSQF